MEENKTNVIPMPQNGGGEQQAEPVSGDSTAAFMPTDPTARKVHDLAFLLSDCLAVHELYGILMGTYLALASGDASIYGPAVAKAEREGKHPRVRLEVTYKAEPVEPGAAGDETPPTDGPGNSEKDA